MGATGEAAGGRGGPIVSATEFDTVQEYLASFPEDVQQRLRAVQDRIRAAAPGADEVISYGIPTVRLEGHTLMHFAGWKHHISVYPVPTTCRRSSPRSRRTSRAAAP
jgi:uncharacterized protein YdhG (YjbR/CyaY superfamily)